MDVKGQGTLEVVMVMPLLFMLVILLFRFNMGIQMAINNVQYARSQLYMLAAHSPEYPRIGLRHSTTNPKRSFYGRNIDMMVLGVADPKAIDEADAANDGMPPIPQVQPIGKKDLPGASTEEGEGHLRAEVNVRETSAICTQKNGVNAGSPYDSNGILALGSQRYPFGKMPCQYEGQWIGGLNE
jgi:hypothetical protein